MPSATVIGTMTLGVDGPPGAVAQGSPNVVFEGRAASAVSHMITPHIRYGSKRPHGRVIATGNPTVLINGMQASYVGCNASCGDVIGPGCATVLVGP